jgi:hypothetical protein
LAIDIAGIAIPAIAEPHYIVDFSVFWAAARIMPELVYDPAALTQAQLWLTGPTGLRPFAYPPSFLILLIPFGWLPHWPALIAWNALSLTLFAAASKRIVPRPAVVLAMISPPVLMCLYMGQSALIVAGLLIAALSCLPTRPLVAGLLLGLAATWKPQALLLVPLALGAAGQWRALAAAILTGVAIGIASVAVQGPQLWLDWLGSLRGFMQVVDNIGLPARGLNPTALAFMLGLSGSAAVALKLSCGLLGAAVVVLVFRSDRAPTRRLAALTAGGMLCSPYSMTYEMAMIAPAAAAILLDRNGHPALWFAALLCFTTLAGPFGPLVMAISLVVTARPRKIAPVGTSTPIQLTLASDRVNQSA